MNDGSYVLVQEHKCFEEGEQPLKYITDVEYRNSLYKIIPMIERDNGSRTNSHVEISSETKTLYDIKKKKKSSPTRLIGPNLIFPYVLYFS